MPLIHRFANFFLIRPPLLPSTSTPPPLCKITNIYTYRYRYNTAIFISTTYAKMVYTGNRTHLLNFKKNASTLVFRLHAIIICQYS